MTWLIRWFIDRDAQFVIVRGGEVAAEAMRLSGVVRPSHVLLFSALLSHRIGRYAHGSFVKRMVNVEPWLNTLSRLSEKPIASQ